ncbi:MAG TPA: hypothetical protein VGS57_12235 [Thermoanaerobaculia bacterium]|jgi:hypothetical protein|nr:hypothetical protein [Thermoanaerobaculia bacterium]
MRRRWYVALLGIGLAAPAFAAAPSRTDVAWTAEHLPESLQDGRLLALPWPARPLHAGERQTTFDLGGESAGADLGDARGWLAAAGATWARSERFGLGGLVFYDQSSISGDGTRDRLRATFEEGVPLALPAMADFGRPRGQVRHWGAGGYAVWERSGSGGVWRRTILAGAYFERLDVEGFRFDYRIVSGPDAGARGELDWSAGYDFATPFAGIGWTRSLGSAWSISPRLVAGQPLPRRRLAGTMSGPGFAVRGRSSGAAMGDAYLGGGLAFTHLSTGLAFDVGSSLWYAATEPITHQGLDRAILVHVAWTH